MGKRKNNRSNSEVPFGTVRDLPPGRGFGTLDLKKGRRIEIQHGRVVVKKKSGTEVAILERFRKENNAFSRIQAFGSGTKVVDWQQEDQCAFCPMPSCNGICEETEIV